jgi:hypothetical protein
MTGHRVADVPDVAGVAVGDVVVAPTSLRAAE